MNLAASLGSRVMLDVLAGACDVLTFGHQMRARDAKFLKLNDPRERVNALRCRPFSCPRLQLGCREQNHDSRREVEQKKRTRRTCSRESRGKETKCACVLKAPEPNRWMRNAMQALIEFSMKSGESVLVVLQELHRVRHEMGETHAL